MTSDTNTMTTFRRETPMRRILVPALAGIGAFLISAAALMRFYAYPTLAVAPVDQDSITHLSAEGATIFDSDPSALKDITTDLRITSHTVGDVKASVGKLRCWGSTTSIKSADGVVRSRSTERDAFDAVSGAAVDGCAPYAVDSNGYKTPVKRSGQILKFPFDTQKRDYPYWVGSVKKAIPARYAGEARIQGMKVYKFVQHVPDTVTGSMTVPGSLFGLKAAGGVFAENHFADTVTMYVDPVTGAVIDRHEAQHAGVEFQGTEVVTTEADIHYTKAQVAKNVDDIGPQAFVLAGLKGWIAATVLVLGLLLLAGAIALKVARSRTTVREVPAGEDAADLTEDAAAR